MDACVLVGCYMRVSCVCVRACFSSLYAGFRRMRLLVRHKCFVASSAWVFFFFQAYARFAVAVCTHRVVAERYCLSPCALCSVKNACHVLNGH